MLAPAAWNPSREDYLEMMFYANPTTELRLQQTVQLICLVVAANETTVIGTVQV